MRRTLWIIGLIAPALIGVRAIAGGEAPSPPEVILLQKCTIDYRHSTLVGSNQNIGRIQECLIRAGDRVKGGQVLGRLFDKDVLAELESRTVALESSETAIHQREATLGVERMKLRRARNLYNRNALSIEDLQLQQLAVNTMELELQAAIQSRRMAEAQLHAAKAMVAAREIVSPHDGVIVEVYKNVGEAITFGMPIYKVVAIDRMRVTGYLDAGDAWHVRQGQAVRIMPELEGGDLPIEREIFEGKITFVDSEIDPKTRTCRVFAEVENRGGLLRSGLECRMEIFPSAASGVVLPSARSGPGPAPDPISALVSTAVVAIHPIELNDVISNPGMGLQTFYNTKATDPNNGTLPLGSAYTRYYWSEFEPSQGNFSFTEMVNDYNAAQAQEQDYCTRISPYDDRAGGPQWLRNLGVSGYTYSQEGGPTLWAPNMDDPTVKAEFQKLVQALGARFDGLPGFGPIDIGSVGLWGEWHNWQAIISSINGNAPGSVGSQIPMPPLATCKWYVDQFFTYFPKTIKIMGSGEAVGSVTTQTLAYALGRGAGWRGDALGDPDHMIQYPKDLPGGANDTHWQTAPVYFEPYSWSGITGALLTQTVDFALNIHASVVHDRGWTFTSNQMPEINRLLMSLGYRFVLNSLSYPAAATAGQQMTLTMAWRNVGVAPTYRNDVLAVQIRNSSGTPVLTSNTGIAVKNWLPGTTYTVTPTVTLPAGLAPGTYTVAIGIVDRATRKPVVQLAVQGRDANGWYPLGTVSVNRRRGDPLSSRLTTGRRRSLASDPAPAGNPRFRPIGSGAADRGEGFDPKRYRQGTGRRVRCKDRPFFLTSEGRTYG